MDRLYSIFSGLSKKKNFENETWKRTSNKNHLKKQLKIPKDKSTVDDFEKNDFIKKDIKLINIYNKKEKITNSQKTEKKRLNTYDYLSSVKNKNSKIFNNKKINPWNKSISDDLIFKKLFDNNMKNLKESNIKKNKGKKVKSIVSIRNNLTESKLKFDINLKYKSYKLNDLNAIYTEKRLYYLNKLNIKNEKQKQQKYLKQMYHNKKLEKTNLNLEIQEQNGLLSSIYKNIQIYEKLLNKIKKNSFLEKFYILNKINKKLNDIKNLDIKKEINDCIKIFSQNYELEIKEQSLRFYFNEKDLMLEINDYLKKYN